MAPLLLGAFVLILILALLRAFVGADPKALVKSLRYVGAAILGIFAILLAVGNRWGPAMFLGSMAWGLFTNGHIWPGGWPHYPDGPSSGSRPGQGESTSVRKPWVEIGPDHVNGEHRGTVLKCGTGGKTWDRLGV